MCIKTELLKTCLAALNEIPNSSLNVGEYKNTYALAAHLGNAIRQNETALKTNAQYVTEHTVIDPDTGLNVEVSIYKDLVSGGMFGIDSSFLMTLSEDDTVIEPFNGHDVVLIDGPYGQTPHQH